MKERKRQRGREGGREGGTHSFDHNNFILPTREISVSLGKSSEKPKLLYMGNRIISSLISLTYYTLELLINRFCKINSSLKKMQKKKKIKKMQSIQSQCFRPKLLKCVENIFSLYILFFFILYLFITHQDMPKKNMYNANPLISGPQTSLDVMFIINFIDITHFNYDFLLYLRKHKVRPLYV